MFWKYNTSSSSQIEGLLGKEDVTLQEVMDADDIINECRAQNKTLIDFLLKPDVMEELVTLTIKEPSIEIEERSRFKYPNIASELLTCDVPALNETLAGNEVLLDKLYSFLECDPPLNPLLASYFSKIMGALIAKKTEQNWLSYQFTCLQVLDFLKAKDTFISLLLKHLGTSAIMDLMLKLMTQVEGVEMRQNILNWLDSQRIMQSLVSLLNPKIDKERHYNVAQLLCDFVRIARDTQRNSTERADPDPLLNTLESPETVALLLDHILKEEKSETAIVGGIQVLLALLDVYQSSIPKFNSQNMYNSNINEEASDIEQKQKIIFNTTRAFCARAKDFHNILLDPPNTTPIVTTVGTLNPPLGNTRLQITKLLATVIASNNEELLNELESIGTFPVLLDLFFKYPWNNFLHTQVENCLISALKTHVSEEIDDTNALTKHLLVNCKLIERILGAWKENDEQQAQEKGIRQGYMGHLISIVNKIVDLCSNTALGQYLKDNLPDVAKTLNDFKDTTLSETNKIQETLLGGAHPNSSVEDNDDYGDIPFPQSSALQQQMFSQYQMQNLTSQYIDGYSGFNDDAFNDGDDTLQTIDHRTDMNFDLSEGDLVQQHEIFKQVCAQNINTLDDADDQIFEDRDHTFQTVIEKQDRNEAVYSSDSDDEQGGDENMDVDPWSSPKPVESRPARAVGSDPWGSDFGSSDATVGGWADFSSAQFDANFASFDGKIKKNVGNKENKQPIVESDLKLESIDSQTDNSKDSKTNSIDKVAQVEDVKSEGPDTIKSAAGDQGGELVSGHQKTSSAAVTEPSKSKEGDHTLHSGSTGKEKVEKDKV
ncbi:serine/threonine-protein phosphatase 6 regulatory subunit 3 isoform X1 [Anoplophora glabripennis]|uniref:serine/threonine-protein phosphatase 6 regulatory subunit 3 isoform X1 n=1 Tax=Anoplophora glabripennis TaxID=217634 RepID=UPI00087568A5|nr:serine/threonine-protein phosphatase 6 regulatory subunit 3 isoform X1 [Anoplophora glabripennis]